MSADSQDKDFLRRWSRLKTEARDEQAGKAAAMPAVTPDIDPPAQEAPVVPPVESLDIESDYRPFFHPKIEEGVRRAALKKLFSDPHFNVMDGLDVYIDDYSKADPLPEGMLDQLEQAKKIFGWSREDAAERAQAEERRRAEQGAARPLSVSSAATEPAPEPPATLAPDTGTAPRVE